MLILGLMPVTAFADASSSVTVNEIVVTEANKDDVLEDGKVSYDFNTNTLNITGSTASLTITGNGNTDIIINSSDATTLVSGGLTISGAKDVKVKQSYSSTAIGGSADIDCTGNISIISSGMAVNGNLTVRNAANVTVEGGRGVPTITGYADINCIGNLSIISEFIAVNNELTVQNAKDVTVKGNGEPPIIGGDTEINCTGDVWIENCEKGSVVGYGTNFSVMNAKNVTLKGGGYVPVIKCDYTFIKASGKVLIEQINTSYMDAAVLDTYLTFNQSEDRGYKVKAGDTAESAVVIEEKAAYEDYFTSSFDMKALVIEPDPYYTISFHANGGNGTMASVEVPSGSYELPECTFTPPAGKMFQCWSRTGSSGDCISGDSLDVTEDITLYACWTGFTFYITNGTAKDGSGNPVAYDDKTRFITEGERITITANAAPADYVFDKWIVTQGFVGLANESSETTTIIMPAENIKIKATYKHANHSYVTTSTTKATTSKNGSVIKKCSVCGATITSTIYYPKTIKLSASAYTYNGKAKTPKVTVVDASGKKISSDNYTVSYAKGRTNVGKYKIIVTFKKNSKYNGGSKSAYFVINPKGTSISKVAGAKKAFTVKWKSQPSKMKTSRITGYQIRYSTSSKMTKAKTVTVKGYKATGKTITKLSAKKKYYIQARTYIKVNGKNYYSSWCKAKSVRTK